jgi:hypothetical protein
MIASQRDDKKGGAKSGEGKNSPGKASKLKSAKPPPPRLSFNDAIESPNHNSHPSLSGSWQPQAPEGLPVPKEVNPAATGGDLTFAMWASLQAAEGRKAAMRGTGTVAVIPPPSPPTTRQVPPMPPLLGQQQHTKALSVPMNLNNLDTGSLQKGNLQDMSEQQRRILAKLENGWKGSVEELMEAVK